MKERLMKILKRYGAFIEGHFVLASGKHGDACVDEKTVCLYPERVSFLAKKIADKFAEEGIEVVVGPAGDGAILANWVASHLAKTFCREVIVVCVDKQNGRCGP